MQGYNYGWPPGPPVGGYSGLAGVAGGIIGLTAATLRGGARLVTTLVETTLWSAPYPGCGPHGYHYGCCSRPVYHNCCVECVPPCYPGCPSSCC